MAVLEYVQLCGSATKACREFEVLRSSILREEESLRCSGQSRPSKKETDCPKPSQLLPETVVKILQLRCKYHLGPLKITWYLECYHGITTSCSSVYRALIRNSIRRLLKTMDRRAIHRRRYAKKVPGHNIQVGRDVPHVEGHRWP